METSPRIRLSSRATVFLRVGGCLAIPLWLGVGLSKMSEMAAELGLPSFLVLLLFSWIGLFFYFLFGQFKTLFLDGETLVVKSWWKETQVPLEAIVGMGGSRMSNPRRVWIEFATPSEVGRFVIFTPELKFMDMYWFQPHANEKLLRNKIVEAKSRVGNNSGQRRAGIKSRSIQDWILPLMVVVLACFMYFSSLFG